MAVSALCILDNSGSAICARDYRGEVPLTAVDKFYSLLSELEESSKATPVLQHDDGISFIWLRHADVYLVALCQSNVNAASTIAFLNKLLEVFKYYFKVVVEESIRDNFVTVYELLDEVMDFGYPQFTEGAILREYIKTEAHKLEDLVGGMLGSTAHSKGNKELPPQVTGVGANWRRQGIFYQRNEVHINASMHSFVHRLQLLGTQVFHALRHLLASFGVETATVCYAGFAQYAVFAQCVAQAP